MRHLRGQLVRQVERPLEKLKRWAEARNRQVRELLVREERHVRAHRDRRAERDAHRPTERRLIEERGLHALCDALLVHLAVRLERLTDDAVTEAPRHHLLAIHQKVHKQRATQVHLCRHPECTCTYQRIMQSVNIPFPFFFNDQSVLNQEHSLCKMSRRLRSDIVPDATLSRSL